jgi:CRP/FNR family cyclic AMP-dependent transcriptional regulator
MPSSPEMIARVPLFAELGPKELQWIGEAAHHRTFAEGECLFEIGEPGRSLFIVTAGTVQVLHPNRATSFQLARIGPGEFIGEMSLLDDSPRSATAKAICEVEALVLDKADFNRLVLERPDVALHLLGVMSRRMRTADEHISGLNSQAVRDPITGLLNRLAFEERLEEETARARRYGGSFSLILIDLDDLEAINSMHGDPVGDAILAWVGRLLNEHTRASDVPFRYEQDAFTILCPWTASDVAVRVAGRLAALVAEAKPPVEAELSITLTYGTATCPDHAREGQALYHHAQRSLVGRSGVR